MINISISQPWSNYIKEGKKTIEGRLNKGKFSELKKNDLLSINDGECLVKIKKIIHYKSFEEMLIFEGLRHVLPNVENLAAGVKIYHKFYTYDDENKYGVIAIKLKLKKKRQ